MKSNLKPPRSLTHITTLDGCRGLAILMVMMMHMLVTTPANGFEAWVFGFVGMGWMGVDLFFVLSGFLITGILLDTKDHSKYFKNFFGRRALRILPLYYAVLIFSLLILPSFDHPKAANFGRIQGDELWYIFYLQNISIAFANTFRHGILDVTWSLAIEEQFYLIWPVVVYYASKRGLQRLCIALFCFALLFRIWARYMEWHPIAVYVLTPSRLDTLVVGAYLATLWRDEAGWSSFLRVRCKCFTAVVLSFLVCWAFSSAPFSRSLVMQTVGYSVIALLFGLVLSFLVDGRRSLGTKLFENRMLVVFGKYSYAMYLFHLPIRAVFRDLIFPPEVWVGLLGSPILYQIIFIPVSVSATLVAAVLSWNLLEIRFLRLKKYFAY